MYFDVLRGRNIKGLRIGSFQLHKASAVGRSVERVVRNNSKQPQQLLLSMFALTLSLGHIPSMEEDEVLARASRNELQQLSCSGLYWRWYVSSRVGQRSIIA